MAAVAGAETSTWPRHTLADRGGEQVAECRSDRDPTPTVLARLIEGEIIPRLLMAHHAPAATSSEAVPSDLLLDHDAAAIFAPLTLKLDVHGLLVHIEALLGRGVGIETVLTDLLAPTARLLGEYWDEDRCDFVDVTMGLWRIQQVVHELASRAPFAALQSDDRRALFAVCPGEQHGLGSIIVEEFFRRAGWQTWSAPALGEAELLAEVASRNYALIGLTVTLNEHVEPLAELVAKLRAAARNPAMLVLVGGRPFTERPELAQSIGADGTAADGDGAVRCAEALVDALRRPHH